MVCERTAALVTSRLDLRLVVSAGSHRLVSNSQLGQFQMCCLSLGTPLVSVRNTRHTLMASFPGLKLVKDNFGNEVLFGDGGEVMFAPVPCIPDYRQHLQRIRDMQLRPDDVIVVGYPKSGNNWIHHEVSMLVEGSTDLPPVFGDNNFTFLDICGGGRELPAPDKPRVLMTHLCFRYLPRDVMDKQVKIVHIVRNPKDATVSLYYHLRSILPPFRYEGTWEQFLTTVLEQGFWYGSIFDHAKDWERTMDENTSHPVFDVFYEKMKKDPLTELEALDAFLGTNRGKEFCQVVADTCQFDNMENTRLVHSDIITRNTFAWEDTRKFFRKGEVGDWKNWFTVAQNEKFDDVCRQKMIGSKRHFIFE